jgi:hypothetical protein
MATFQERSDKWRAIVRKKGHEPQTKTFQTKGMAQRWAREVERDMEGHEFNDPRQLDRFTLGDLIDRYAAEMPEAGRTKAGCHAMLKRELGSVALSDLNKPRIVAYAHHRAKDHGAGPATMAQDLIYLRGILETARAHWDIPVRIDDAVDARLVLRREGLVRSLRSATASRRKTS